MINVLGFIVIILLLVGCTRKDSGNIPVEQMNIISNNTMCEMVLGTTMESVLSSTNPLFISADSGFYSENFDLFIASYQDMDIYYTLDGSTPNKSSIKYTGPIHICDATNKPNVYSMRTDVAGGYIGVPEDYVSDLYYKYAIPDYYVDKCNIVRISVFDGEKEI